MQGGAVQAKSGIARLGTGRVRLFQDSAGLQYQFIAFLKGYGING